MPTDHDPQVPYEVNKANQATHINAALLAGVLFFGLLTLVGCEGTDKESSDKTAEEGPATQLVEMGDDYGLRTEIRGNRSIQRKWAEPKIKEVASLSEGDEYTLYSPRIAPALSEEGHLFAFDYGDHTVKSFSQEGEYVATYGRGQGQGPGMMTVMSDVGVWKDSLVYVVDPRQRRVSFFKKDGTFVRTEPYEIPLARLEWSDDLTEYAASRGASFFLRMVSPEHRSSVSQFTSGGVHPIMRDGTLHTIRDRALYVPPYFPVLLTFSPDDTTGVAYPTPDYGRPRPAPRTSNEGRQITAAPSVRLQGLSVIHNGVLSVTVPAPDAENLQVDLYDADGVNYRRSVQLPLDESEALYVSRKGNDVVATVREATVSIYEVQNTEEQPVDE